VLKIHQLFPEIIILKVRMIPKLSSIFKLSSFLAAVLVSQGHNNPETIVKLLKIHTKVLESIIQKID